MAMNYLSTRGSGGGGVSAAVAIRDGIAPDGGLYTPESIPRLTPDEIGAMAGMDYRTLALTILKYYLPDYPADNLQRMVAAAYAYPGKFAAPQITPVVRLKENQYIIELWHGPTCAFKDLALQLLPHLLTEASRLTHNPKEIVILVATSGDTGKAALEGFKDIPGTRIIVFFPEEGVSAIQRLQMVTQEGKNTAVAAVKGNFDDAQTGVKQVFTDPDLLAELDRARQTFSSANSINWGRLAPQIVYYFYGYLEMVRQGAVRFGDRINIAVPTGNFGNILAAYLAKEMGLPVRKLICASNSNNVLTDFLNTGFYNRERQFQTTISPSMDILISSNLERLLYYISGRDSRTVREWMAELKTVGSYRIDPTALARIQACFYGGFATEPETMATIKNIFATTGKTLDTHTAVGQRVYEKYLRETGDATPVLIAATASPFKFNSSVVRALRGEAAVKGRTEFELLGELRKISGMSIPGALAELEGKPERYRTVCERGQMAAVVREILGLA